MSFSFPCQAPPSKINGMTGRMATIMTSATCLVGGLRPQDAASRSFGTNSLESVPGAVTPPETRAASADRTSGTAIDSTPARADTFSLHAGRTDGDRRPGDRARSGQFVGRYARL